eukprot:TRINITY_DN3594_c0_g1_i2.p1 TRINITY_DN3594_c0_g1~~TRINITY_DN3594_c0_g1_i2.p1  ORF type:complete len:109 (+),score=1.39 TRINITY_DN3594_c0_g1_i2:220-546(+)
MSRRTSCHFFASRGISISGQRGESLTPDKSVKIRRKQSGTIMLSLCSCVQRNTATHTDTHMSTYYYMPIALLQRDPICTQVTGHWKGDKKIPHATAFNRPVRRSEIHA